MPKNKGKLQELKEGAEHSLSLHEWMEIDPVEILKLVVFVESFRNWRSYASVENFQILRKAENDLEDA